MSEAIAGVDELELLGEYGVMTDAAFADLVEQIEWHMTELRRLQDIYRSQTGRDYVMPVYVGKRG